MTPPLSVAHQSEHTGPIGIRDSQFGHANDKEGQDALKLLLESFGPHESHLFACYSYPSRSDPARTERFQNYGSGGIWHGHPPPVFIDDDFIVEPEAALGIVYADLNFYRGPCLMPDETLAGPKQSVQQSRARTTAPRSNPIDDALTEFSRDKHSYLIQLARYLVEEAKSHTSNPEITVDLDGALSFDLRLQDGNLLFGELNSSGTFSVTVLDDRDEKTSVKEHYSDATVSQFVELL